MLNFNSTHKAGAGASSRIDFGGVAQEPAGGAGMMSWAAFKLTHRVVPAVPCTVHTAAQCTPRVAQFELICGLRFGDIVRVSH